MYLYFKQVRIWILLVALVFVGCSKQGSSGGTSPTNPTTPTNPTNPTTPTVVDNRFPVNLIVDSLTLAYIRTQALTNTEMSAAMESIIMQPAFNNLSKTPLPYLEVSSDNFNDISAQANSCKIFEWSIITAKYLNKLKDIILVDDR